MRRLAVLGLLGVLGMLAGCGRSTSVRVVVPEETTAVADLAEALGDPDEEVRYAAAVDLARFGPEAKQAVPGLVKLLGQGSAFARASAAQTLGKIGPAAVESAPDLAKVLADPDVDVRR